ncbi:MAG: sulfotransferase [Asticcacaulis sp.]
MQSDPSVLHFRGAVTTQLGEFEQAALYFRRALAILPFSEKSWFALTVIKTFKANDPDIKLMETIWLNMPDTSPEKQAQFLYALAKAYSDTQDSERATRLYSKGASLMYDPKAYDSTAWSDFARQLVTDYTRENMTRLHPSTVDSERVIFVNGLPRSGTTLVEQILTSHSMVHDGGEANSVAGSIVAGGRLLIRRSIGLSEPHR